jgi:hypothetical protein
MGVLVLNSEHIMQRAPSSIIGRGGKPLVAGSPEYERILTLWKHNDAMRAILPPAQPKIPEAVTLADEDDDDDDVTDETVCEEGLW